IFAAVYAIERLEKAARASAALLEPAHERVRLVFEADPEKDEHRKGCIPQPGVAVIPILCSPYGLRQPHGRRGHQCAGWLEGQKLESQRGAVHHVPPPPTVSALRDPPPPVVQRLLQKILTLGPLQGFPRPLAFLELLQDKTGALARLQLEPPANAPARPFFERHLAGEVQGHARASKDHAALDELDLVLPAGGGEGWGAIYLRGHPTLFDPPIPGEGLKRLMFILDGHEVQDLGDAFRGEETGKEHVGVWQVELVT